MTTRHADLMAAILADLDADEPRMVLADALQAAGDPRGELIAIQCELGRGGCNRTRWAMWAMSEWADKTRRARQDLIGDAFATFAPRKLAALRKRERALLDIHLHAWSAGLGNDGRFARGFVEHVIGGEQPNVARLFDLAPTMRSLEIGGRCEPAALFDEPRTWQLQQLRVNLAASTSDTFIARLPELPQLRELAIGGLDDDRAFDRFAASPSIARLEALDLDGQTLDTPERIAQLLDVARIRALRIGSWYRAGVTPSSVLANTPRAAELEILDIDVFRRELGGLVGSRHLQNLRALVMFMGYEDSRHDVQMVGDAFQKLELLDLSYNELDLATLCYGRGLSRLAHLRLNRCDIDDAALAELTGSPLLGRLRTLELRNNKLTDAGARALVAAAPARLELIDVSSNHFSVAGRELLRKQFPNTRVLTGAT